MYLDLDLCSRPNSVAVNDVRDFNGGVYLVPYKLL